MPFDYRAHVACSSLLLFAVYPLDAADTAAALVLAPVGAGLRLASSLILNRSPLPVKGTLLSNVVATAVRERVAPLPARPLARTARLPAPSPPLAPQVVVSVARAWPAGRWSFAVRTGLCGSLSTASTFARELHMLVDWRDGRPVLTRALAYASASIVGAQLVAAIARAATG
jgi:fluoride ion exporter CrcB/FEX